MTTQNDNSGIYRVGDLVIGSSDPGKSVYSATGAKLLQDGVSIYGSEKDLSDQRKEISRSAIRSGGTPIPIKPSNQLRTGRKSSAKKTRGTPKPKQFSYDEYMADMEVETSQSLAISLSQEEPMETIQFENSFGKIKAKVINVVEHDLAFMLTFRSEDDMVFEPKVGESLVFYTPNKYRYEVYYPGVTFDSPDSGKKVMILFKVPEENQE